MKTIYHDRGRYQFLCTFGYHRCFRDKTAGTLVLHCRTSNIGNTVGINKDARDEFLKFEAETPHTFHLETPDRSEVFAAEEMPDFFHPLLDYAIFNVDNMLRAREAATTT